MRIKELTTVGSGKCVFYAPDRLRESEIEHLKAWFGLVLIKYGSKPRREPVKEEVVEEVIEEPIKRKPKQSWRLWSDKEDETLVELYFQNKPNSYIAKVLKRSPGAVANRRSQLLKGIQK